MKNAIIRTALIYLMSTNILYTVAQDAALENVLRAMTDEELQKNLTQSQDEKELFSKMGNSGIYALIETTQSQMQATTNTLSNAQKKMKSALEEFASATTPDDTLSHIADLITIIKNLGASLTTQVSNHLNELYAPIARSSMVTDETIKSQITAQLEPGSIQQQAPAQPIQQPAPNQKTTPAPQPITIKDKNMVNKTGVEGLYQFITLRVVKGLSDKEKELIIAEIKKNSALIQDSKDAFNTAAKAAADQLNIVKNSDPTSLANIRKTFTFQQSADYDALAPMGNYENLVTTYNAMQASVETLCATISAADAGILKFIGVLFGTSSTDETFVELKKQAAKQAELIESTNELLATARTTIAKAKKIFTQPITQK